MGIHHLVTEGDREWCFICGRKLEPPWESAFDGDKHYKVKECDCGYLHSIRIDFFGSGHDTWDGTPAMASKVRKLERQHSRKI
jgi:hypothetical protein